MTILARMAIRFKGWRYIPAGKSTLMAVNGVGTGSIAILASGNTQYPVTVFINCDNEYCYEAVTPLANCDNEYCYEAVTPLAKMMMTRAPPWM